MNGNGGFGKGVVPIDLVPAPYRQAVELQGLDEGQGNVAALAVKVIRFEAIGDFDEDMREPGFFGSGDECSRVAAFAT